MLVGLAVLARLAGRIGVPAIPLYLLAGLAFGEGGLLPLAVSRDFVRTGSEVGLILLLFTLGLEYSASELLDTMRRSVPAGAMNLVLNYLPGFAAGLALGWGTLAAVFMGGITLVTSSSVAAKIMGDLGWIGSPGSRFVLSISIMEDLTMAAYLPALGGFLIGGVGILGIGSAVVAVSVVVGLLVAARRFDLGVGRLLFSHSDEALVLGVVGFALVVAGLAEAVQASAAIGALLAGIVLSGPAARTAGPLLTPLRDVFAALFFAVIGLSVHPADVWSAALPAVVLGIVSVATKVTTALWGGAMSGLEPRERFRAASALIPRGEFSLALAALASTAAVHRDLPALAVAYVLFLAVVAPVAARAVDALTSPARRS